MCCSVLQCVAVCGSVLQCVAVCCRVSFQGAQPYTHTHTLFRDTLIYALVSCVYIELVQKLRDMTRDMTHYVCAMIH